MKLKTVMRMAAAFLTCIVALPMATYHLAMFNLPNVTNDGVFWLAGLAGMIVGIMIFASIADRLTKGAV